MISFIQGQIKTITSYPPRVVIIVGGIGYEVNLPAYVSESLETNAIIEGSDIEFQIYTHITERQPKPYLVGFLSENERRFFEQIIEVEGIGPSKAISALIIPPSRIAHAIETEDIATLTSLPGIGNRAAQKMIATLKGRIEGLDLTDTITDTPSVPTFTKQDTFQEAVKVLVSLGYRNAEARQALNNAVRTNPNVVNDITELVREVFRTYPLANGDK